MKSEPRWYGVSTGDGRTMPSIPVDIRINLDLEPGEVVDEVGSNPAPHGFDVWAMADGIKRVIARVLPIPKDVWQPRYRQPGKWRIKPGSLAYELAHAKPEDVAPKRRRKAA